MVEGIGRSEANWAGDWPVASLKIVLSSSWSDGISMSDGGGVVAVKGSSGGGWLRSS